MWSVMRSCRLGFPQKLNVCVFFFKQGRFDSSSLSSASSAENETPKTRKFANGVKNASSSIGVSHVYNYKGLGCLTAAVYNGMI